MEIGVLIKITLGIAVAISAVYYKYKKGRDKKSLTSILQNEFSHFDINTAVFSHDKNELFAVSDDEFILLTEDMDGNRHSDISKLDDLTHVDVVVNNLTASNLLIELDESAVTKLWREGAGGYKEVRSLMIKFKIKNDSNLGLPSLDLAGDSTKLNSIVPVIRRIRQLVANDS